MSIRAIFGLIGCVAVSAAPAAQLDVTVRVAGGGSSSGDIPFTALHTYFISPTGNDSANGASAAAAWATPNHPVACGDVVIATAGAYNSERFDSHSYGAAVWGTPSGCPSTTGGIDGNGGVYTTTLLCEKAFACTIDASTGYAMAINKSNWAVEGFQGTSSRDGNGACFHAHPTKGDSLAFVAFINDIASGCPLVGFGADGQAPNFNNAIDEFAVVGSIAFDASRSASYCGSGMGMNTPVNVNNLAGTHVFFSQDFSYGNVDGPCSVNSNYKGAFTNMAANAQAGASAIAVAAVNGWGANWPIGAAMGANYAFSSTAIPAGTMVSSVSGTTIGLSNKVAPPGLASGQLLAIAVTTDGNGIIFDTWAHNPYTGKAAVENNIVWRNGSQGIQVFCGGGLTCASKLDVTITQNTMYCDAQDYKRDGNAWELYENTSVPGDYRLSVTNNLAQACVKKPANSQTFPPWNGKTGVGQAGTGQPVVAGGFGRAGTTVTGNYFFSVPGVACPVYATCDPGNNIAMYNGANYLQGNTFADPRFAAPDTLPSTAPDCGAFSTVVECMSKVVAAMKSGAAPGKGYQPPAAQCQPDPLYPTWLKGVVYLAWTGSAVVQRHGLVTTPCGL